MGFRMPERLRVRGVAGAALARELHDQQALLGDRDLEPRRLADDRGVGLEAAANELGHDELRALAAGLLLADEREKEPEARARNLRPAA